jgi:predicted acyl esterase/methionine-rich copper-binding protein CopC
LNEQKTAKATAEFFAGKGVAYTDETRTTRVSVKDFTTGKVAMFGTSYVGALPIMAAVAGAEGLVAISPDSSPGSWYEYYRANGGYKGPAGYPGEDTDIHAKFNYSSMNYSHADNPRICDPVFESLEQTQDRASGNYSDFWEVRNYAKTIKNWNVGVLIEGGFRDWNVMFKHQSLMIEQLKAHNKNWQAWLHQQGHGNSHPTSLIRNLFFTHYLYGGAPAGGEQKVWVKPSIPLERTGTNWNNVQPEEFPTWPVPGAEDVTLNLAPGEGQEMGSLSFAPNSDIAKVESLTDKTRDYAEADGPIYTGSSNAINYPYSFGNSTTSDTPFTTIAGDTAVTGHRLIYASDPIARDVRLSGTPKVSLNMALMNRTKANVSVLLVSYPAPGEEGSNINSNPQVVSRGWVDPQNRTSLYVDDPITPGEFYQISWTLDPKDYILTAGSRLALVVLSTDPGYSVRPVDGTELAVRPALSSLTLPLVGGSFEFKQNLVGQLASLEVVPSATEVVAGDDVTVEVSGVGAEGASFGDLTAEAVLSSSEASDVIDGVQVTGTKAGARTVTAQVGRLSATFELTVTPGPVIAATGLEAGFAPASLDGQSLLAGTSGQTIEVAKATGRDVHGNPIDLGAPVVASSDPSDKVTGSKIVLGDPGLRTITVTAGGLSRTYTAYVGAVAAPKPTETPVENPGAIQTPQAELQTAPVVGAKLSGLAVTTVNRGTLDVSVVAPKSVHGSAVTVIFGTKSVVRRLGADGKVTVKLPKVAPGKHRVVVVFEGAPGVTPLTSTIGWVTVTKPAAKTVTVKPVAKTAKAGKAKFTVRVSHPGVQAATGKVTVKITKNGKTVTTKSYRLRTADKGKTTITIPKLVKPGTYTVKATYAGNTILATKNTKPTKITIK